MQKKQTNTKKISLHKEKVMTLSKAEMANIIGKGPANIPGQNPNDQNDVYVPTHMSGTGSVELPKLF